MGYLGSLSQDPLGRIFSKCAFLNLLSPLVLPYLQKFWDPPKNLKIFQGAVSIDCRCCPVSRTFPTVGDLLRNIFGMANERFWTLLHSTNINLTREEKFQRKCGRGAHFRQPGIWVSLKNVSTQSILFFMPISCCYVTCLTRRAITPVLEWLQVLTKGLSMASLLSRRARL